GAHAGGGGGRGSGGASSGACGDGCEEIVVVGERGGAFFGEDAFFYSFEQLGIVTFNETTAVTGARILEARIALINVLINELLNKKLRDKVGDCKHTACDRITRSLNMEETMLLNDLIALAEQVVRDRAAGLPDPTGGALFFNYREIGGRFPNLKLLSTLPHKIYPNRVPISVIGPFENRCPKTVPACGSDLGATGIYLVLFTLR
ncbi:MAG: hypothetical protein D6694_13900, partial [Gammaproteobacteria bacterium]